MVGVTTASMLASALTDVPALLLDSGDRRNRAHALAALDEYASLVAEPRLVVVIGGGGSGKSSVANALVGAEVVAVSAVRPTTTGVTVIGRSEVAPMQGVVEYVFTDHLREGVVIVDTPSWDAERRIIAATVADAHTVVVVLTPSRYADAVTSEVIADLPDSARVVIVVNRLPADPDDSDDILDDIETTFNAPIVAQVADGEPFRLPGSLLDEIPVDRSPIDARRSHARTAADIGRVIARNVSASAVQLGDVQRVLADSEGASTSGAAVSVHSSWTLTRDASVEAAAASVAAFDTFIIEESHNELAVRVKESLTELDTDSIRSDLDDWQKETADMFRRRASVRWRKRSMHDLVDDWSWILSIDVHAKPPRRVARAMRGAIEVTANEGRQNLQAILDAPLRDRTDEWIGRVARIGDYRPGVLFTASDAMDGGEAVHD